MVAVSGVFYNAGLLATPWFEGRLAQCLADVLRGNETSSKMISLVICYIVVTIAVQGARFIKRFYVRRFANNINRKMKSVLYANLVRQNKVTLKTESIGELLTKAVSDADDCSEGMRKFTTEVFDTGVAMACYATMLFVYDWRLAFCSLIFTLISYFCAAKMKKYVQRAGAEYKKAVEELGTATSDRVENAVTYRLYGCEENREKIYEKVLENYKRSAVKSNVWQSALSPLYFVCSSVGVSFILWFGAKNVLGRGWNNWDIAAFTTFFLVLQS